MMKKKEYRESPDLELVRFLYAENISFDGALSGDSAFLEDEGEAPDNWTW